VHAGLLPTSFGVDPPNQDPMPQPPRRRGLLSRAIAACLAAVAVLGGCAEQTEPLPAPIVARPLEEDSLQLGPMAIVCRQDDPACVPTYAVACPAPWVGDSTQAGTVAPLPLSPEEQAWCVVNARAGSGAP